MKDAHLRTHLDEESAHRISTLSSPVGYFRPSLLGSARTDYSEQPTG